MNLGDMTSIVQLKAEEVDAGGNAAATKFIKSRSKSN